MKVILSNYDSLKNPYYAGGGAIATHKLASHLAKKHQVTVLCGKYPHFKNSKQDRVFYKHIGIVWGGPQFGQIIFFLVLHVSVFTEIFDLWIESFFTPAFIPLFTKKPVIGLVHMLAGPDLKRKYKLPFPVLEWVGFKVYRSIITTSQEIQKTVVSYSPKAEVVVIPNGIDLPKQLVRRKKKHILFVGRIEVNQKGLDLLLSAYKKVESEIKITLVIAGSGERRELSLLHAMVLENGLSKQVKLVGHVGGIKKKKLLEEALYIIIPSRFETFCMVVLDAFAYGIPVITFDIKGLSWVPSQFSQKVASFSVGDLADAIKKMAVNEDFRNKKSYGTKEYIKQFEWKHVLHKYEEYVDTVMKQHYGKAH